MADTHHHGADHGPNIKVYLTIALALGGFTIVSFVCNSMVRSGSMSAMAAFVIILAVAIVKATLVGLYFMHLKYEWAKLYFMIAPVFILGTMMMIVLLPDIVLAWHNEPFLDGKQPGVTAKP